MKKLEDMPDEFYIGKDFVEDTETEETIIEILFYSPAVLDSFELRMAGKKIIGSQKTGLLTISFEQILSKKLIQNLMWGKSEEYIIGYVSKYLPTINEEILRQRYTSGHFLIRTFSTLDIHRVNIQVPSIAEGPVFLSWPQSITSFPPAKRLAEKNDEIYIRDFIDAGNAYLSGNYDDCIRKSITSVENAFRKYNLKSDSPTEWKRFFPFIFSKETKFDRIVKNIISSKNLGRSVIAENLLFLYKLRNKIVQNVARTVLAIFCYFRTVLAIFIFLYLVVRPCPIRSTFLSRRRVSRYSNIAEVFFLQSRVVLATYKLRFRHCLVLWNFDILP